MCASLGARVGIVANGSLFLGAFGILTVTGYGLYYAGGESLRAWTSWIHLAVGLALPLLLIASTFLARGHALRLISTRSRFASGGVKIDIQSPVIPGRKLHLMRPVPSEFQVANRRVL